MDSKKLEKQEKEKAEILRMIKEYGSLSIFWATANQTRARQLTALEKSGVISRDRQDKRDAYPYMIYRINGTQI